MPDGIDIQAPKNDAELVDQFKEWINNPNVCTNLKASVIRASGFTMGDEKIVMVGLTRDQLWVNLCILEYENKIHPLQGEEAELFQIIRKAYYGENGDMLKKTRKTMLDEELFTPQGSNEKYNGDGE